MTYPTLQLSITVPTISNSFAQISETITPSSSETISPVIFTLNQANIDNEQSNVDNNTHNRVRIEEEEKDASSSDDENDTVMNDTNLSFSAWLNIHLEKATRKRFVITDNDYDLLLTALNNENILKGRNDLKWIRTLKSKHNLQVQKIRNNDNDGYIDVVIKPKKRSLTLLPNDIPYTIVAKISQLQKIIQQYHMITSHSGVTITFNRIKEKYSFIPRVVISAFIKRCKECIELKDKRKRSSHSLTPIISHGTFDHIVIDLIDYSYHPAGPDNTHNYVIHAVDHFSTFHFTDSITHKTAHNILRFLQRLFTTTGYPCVLHSDNGSEFKNSIVDSYLKSHQIQHRRGKPRRPTTQGKVERANRTLKNAIKQLLKSSPPQTTWYDVLFEATLSLNTNYSRVINKSPYTHVFHQKLPNREAMIDVFEEEDVSSSNSDTSSDDIIDLTSINSLKFDKRLVRKIMNDSYKNYLRNAQRMKEYHSRRNMPPIRNIGEVVAISVPEIYITNGYTNKIPAVVVAYEVLDDTIYYFLGYKNSIIKGRFIGADLITVNATTFAESIGLNPDRLDDKTIYAKYGKSRGGRIRFITVKEVYDAYTSIYPRFSVPSAAIQSLNSTAGDNSNVAITSINTGDENFQDEHSENIVCDGISGDTSSVHSQSDTSSLLNAQQDTFSTSIQSNDITNIEENPNSLTPDKVVPNNNICVLCDEMINDSNDAGRCVRCTKYFHQPTNCKYGMCTVKLDDNTYCSMKCCKNWEVYEVKILSETAKYYRILWSNGAVSNKSKNKMRSLAEYFKIVTIWKENQTINL